MTVRELLQRFESVSDTDVIDIYVSDGKRTIHLLTGTYNEVPYTKMENYLDCKVRSFSCAAHNTLLVKISEIEAVRIIEPDKKESGCAASLASPERNKNGEH